MPLYEYECPKCSKIREELHSMSETPEIVCDDCGKRCHKIISKTTFHAPLESKSTSYKMERAMKKGAEERREAQKASHMGHNPYRDMQVSAPDIVDDI